MCADAEYHNRQGPQINRPRPIYTLQAEESQTKYEVTSLRLKF